MAKGAVTELSPDAHITGILTAREIEYAAASVGEAYNPINFIGRNTKLHINPSNCHYMKFRKKQIVNGYNFFGGISKL